MIRQLITDADILSGRVSSPIVLGPGIVLTPAARDRAAARGMTVVEAAVAATNPLSAHGAHAAPDTPCSAQAPHAHASSARSSCANCSCPGCAHCKPAAPTLPVIAGATCGKRPDELGDGLYLVRVQGGVTVSVLPAAGTGLLAKSRSP